MLFQKKLLILISIGLSACASLITYTDNQTTSIFENYNFSEEVGVAFITNRTSNKIENNTPVVSLGNVRSLILQYDLLNDVFKENYVTIIHCNYNWKKSGLNSIEYLKEYNEFPVNKYTFSQVNLTPYVSYTFTIPQVTKSGNYIAAVYDKESDELLFYRRFIVYEKSASISSELTPSSRVDKRKENHEIKFNVSYPQLKVPNPLNDIKIIILQNHNWHTAIEGLKPTLIKPDQNYLEYQHFNLENNFAAINEFRFFDTRMLSARGMNIDRIFRSQRGIEVMVSPASSKKGNVYSEVLLDDLNGGFILSNIDPNENNSQAEYTWVNISLKEPKLYDADVFIAGKYNSWSLSSSNKMIYNDERGQYEGSIYLKQGFYNYMFFTSSSSHPFYYFEGSHFQTINHYEILAYYREPGTIYDRVVGYREFSSRN